MRKLWRPLRVGFVVALLLVSAYGGLVDGWSSLAGAVSIGQRITAATQLMYGILSVACLIALVAARRLVRTLLVLWGIELTLTAALASVFWGGSRSWWVRSGLSVALVRRARAVGVAGRGARCDGGSRVNSGVTVSRFVLVPSTPTRRDV